MHLLHLLLWPSLAVLALLAAIIAAVTVAPRVAHWLGERPYREARDHRPDDIEAVPPRPHDQTPRLRLARHSGIDRQEPGWPMTQLDRHSRKEIFR